MGTVDVYRITNQLDDATLDVLLTRLEARGKHPRFADMLREYLDAMAIDSVRSVLDLGCGTGVAARDRLQTWLLWSDHGHRPESTSHWRSRTPRRRRGRRCEGRLPGRRLAHPGTARR